MKREGKKYGINNTNSTLRYYSCFDETPFKIVRGRTVIRGKNKTIIEAVLNSKDDHKTLYPSHRQMGPSYNGKTKNGRKRWSALTGRKNFTRVDNKKDMMNLSLC